MRKLTLVFMALALTAGFALAGSNDLEGYDIKQSFQGESKTTAAKVDTFLAQLVAGGDAYWDFSSATNPAQGDRQDWVGVDLTFLEPKWHVDNYACEDLGAVTPNVGNYCAWAGEVFAYDCGGTFEGYGNGYNELLVWSGTPVDPLEQTNVHVTAYVHVESETSYDYLYLEWDNGGTWETIVLSGTVSGGLDGIHDNLYIDVTQTVPAGSDVNIRFRAASDGAWSDEDCLSNPIHTTRGLAMVDEISVYFDQGGGDVLQSYEDFQGLKDFALGDWTVVVAPRVGDFSDVWDFLGDVDPCVDNVTPQMAFIDYGQIPGVGPSTSTEWNYGPNGYVVNSTGGIDSDPNTWLDNAIWSPVIDLGGAIGHEFRFSVYRHFALFEMAGMFYTWNVRSSVDGLIWGGWSNRNYVYYGGPDYIRVHNDVTDLLTPGAQYGQISLEIFQWPQYGAYEDATPAPYFDDVSWHLYEYSGPGISYREFELAQDNFPAELNWADLGAADVPFIMGNDIIGTDAASLVHGDSIVLNIDAIRNTAGLTGRPRMYYEVKQNPVFDASVRTSGTPYSGYVEGDTIFIGSLPAVGRWAFDLPDADFLYPGDVLHYYFSAEDTILGGLDAVTTTLPADLSGFGEFPGDAGYIQFQWPADFTMHALPTVLSTTDGDVPDILHYNDFGDRGGENEWYGAYSHMGMVEGVDYDIYHVNSPSSGTGNGLGSTATAALVGLYDHMTYTHGDLRSLALNGPKYWDATEGEWAGDGSDDIDLVSQFIDGGGNFFGTGNGFLVATYVDGAGTGSTFTSVYCGVNVYTRDIRLYIDGQSAPKVLPMANGSGLALSTEFIAYGSCPNFMQFDGVEAIVEAETFQVAEFADVDGNGGAYTWAAMVAKERAGAGLVVTSPVDLMYYYTPYGVDAKANVDPSVRTIVLCDVLRYFDGNPAYCDPYTTDPTVGAGIQQPFFAKNYPNPFNPITTIKFSVPISGHVSLKVFNVRGELVRTLVDEVRSADTYVMEWDGTDDRGQGVASGVYFYETKTNGKSIVNKMALVK